MKLLKRTTCRVCGEKALVDILSLGNLAISGFFDAKKAGLFAPLTLALCDPKKGGCSLVQLRHTSVSPDLLYRQYWYKSGMNQSMREALQDIVDQANRLIKLKPQDIVVDIGANDGTLLRLIKRKNLVKIGFEPAINLVSEAMQGGNIIINTFFNATDFKNSVGIKRRAKLITTIAMFYDLEDPNQFVSDVKAVLDEKGIWINQMSYLPLMLSQHDFMNICHEHLEYYSLTSLQFLLSKHDLQVFDVSFNDVNGGSFRVCIGHKGVKVDKSVEAVLASEKELKLSDKKTYEHFADFTKDLKKKLRSLINTERKNNKKFYVYGASTKGNTLLQYFKLDHSLIEAAVDRNPAKWGKQTVATHIPIISELTAREEKPDYLLVLPWHFKEEFVKREKDYLASGGKMIFPLPNFHIVTM